MAISTGKKGKLFTEINITPLTDIFLVLLIIMMVVAPTFQSMDNAITIPEINSGVAIEHNRAEVAISKEGAMYVNGKQIASEMLTEELIAIKESLEKPEVVALNKCDAVSDDEIAKKIAKLEKACGKKVFAISAVAKKGLFDCLLELNKYIKRERKKLKESDEQEQKPEKHEWSPL